MASDNCRYGIQQLLLLARREADKEQMGHHTEVSRIGTTLPILLPEEVATERRKREELLERVWRTRFAVLGCTQRRAHENRGGAHEHENQGGLPAIGTRD